MFCGRMLYPLRYLIDLLSPMAVGARSVEEPGLSPHLVASDPHARGRWKPGRLHAVLLNFHPRRAGTRPSSSATGSDH